ncbi:ribonucleases P/MRP protein subunit POP1 [Pogonomyrmex barbatus]|uniref:Ribonucleases P/MRP protein subunit POP1 n=1 Tax=Pogonomyrmex barbatus TaxID=144034 RepID=A0A8N1SAB6_9HYME|nr:ribonucleases P/MRP protein subunit POP1 [Pogonomyrmex barbatus]XP_025074938.1 ribonucleases P/MRP protein subunit POP1 [Pogonomyrmex barbatus]
MERKHFDEVLGGLPYEVSIMNFVSSRAHEISAMTSSIENPKQTKLIFQKLPIYMRRRVMSHNVKRLPHRLRQAHAAQMAKSGNSKDLSFTNKRPSRKYRRRPSNLLSEYNRRQQNKIWLETHIWHAKRFHMINKWGYKIANHPNDKCFRANYRAARKHCLIVDMSYYTCIEITGEENLLITTLRTHCNTTTLTFAAKKYIDGHREGTLMFFKRNGYPYFPIGNVNFFWQPKKSDIRTIWIWIHPAFYDDFLNEIISSFEFKLNKIEQELIDTIPNLYTNDAGCKMIILKNILNRFRLHGPLSLEVLTKALQLPSLSKLDFSSEIDYTILNADNLSNMNKMDTSKILEDSNIQSTEQIATDEISEENITISEHLSTQLKKKAWYINYYKKQENMEAFEVQEQMWQKLKNLGSPNHLPTNMIMGITVLDPRFYLPEKRTKCNIETAETFSQSILVEPLPNSNCSPIWDIEIRRIVSSSYMSTSIINKLRSECLVPGISNDQYYDENIMAKIPIFLIQKPGTITGM